MTCVDAMKAFSGKVLEEEKFYSGGQYFVKFAFADSELVDGKTSYLNLPTKVRAQGFICKDGNVVNFYAHNGSGYDTFTDLNKFLDRISQPNK